MQSDSQHRAAVSQPTSLALPVAIELALTTCGLALCLANHLYRHLKDPTPSIMAAAGLRCSQDLGDVVAELHPR
jgi:hypothetical protein